MEAGAPTPLLDLFRQGGVDRDIRLMAAQGVLGLRSFEQVAVCELLGSDADTEVAEAAAAWLRAFNREAPEAVTASEPTAADEEKGEGSPLQKIAAMSPAQRLALAMKGSREERAILVRDPNRIVAVAVLSSPKTTETEIEGIAKMANVSHEILRIIGHTRAWLKNYAIVSALTKNAKTPVAVSLNLLSRLLEKDVKMLATDRNIPEVLRLAARRRLLPK